MSSATRKSSADRSTWSSSFADRLRRSHWRTPIIAAVLWQVALTIAGRLIDVAHSAWGDVGFLDGILAHTTGWDSSWYLGIIEHGYTFEPSSVAFYPLFPALVAALEFASFGLIGLLPLALLVNTVALAAILRALDEILARFGVVRRFRGVGAVALLTAPPAIYLHMFYTEALFLAVASWAYLFALRRNWAGMGVMLALATATRLPGILVAGLCALEFARAHGWRPARFLRPSALWLLSAGAGIGAYALYLWATFGDPLAMVNNLRASSHWTYHVFNPNFIGTIGEAVSDTVQATVGSAGTLTYSVLFFRAFPVFSLAVMVVAAAILVLLHKARAIPLAAFALVAVVFYSLNDNVTSVHRYAVVIITVFVAAASAYQRWPRARLPLLAAAYLGALLQAWWLYLWIVPGLPIA